MEDGRLVLTLWAGRTSERISLPSCGLAAVGLVPDEMLHLRADVLVELAEVLLAASQQQSAEHASSEAARLYTLKGNIVSAEQLPLLRRS